MRLISIVAGPPAGMAMGACLTQLGRSQMTFERFYPDARVDEVPLAKISIGAEDTAADATPKAAGAAGILPDSTQGDARRGRRA